MLIHACEASVTGTCVSVARDVGPDSYVRKVVTPIVRRTCSSEPWTRLVGVLSLRVKTSRPARKGKCVMRGALKRGYGLVWPSRVVQGHVTTAATPYMCMSSSGNFGLVCST